MTICGRLTINRAPQINESMMPAGVKSNTSRMMLTIFSSGMEWCRTYRQKSIPVRRHRWRKRFALHTFRQSSGNNVFRHIPGRVCSGTVHFRRIFSAKCPSAVMCVAAICIDDNFPSCQADVALWPADDKTSSRVDEIFCVFIQQFGRNGRFNDMFNHICVDLRLFDFRMVLR